MKINSFKKIFIIIGFSLSIILILTYVFRLYEYFLRDKTLYLLTERQSLLSFSKNLSNTKSIVFERFFKTLMENPLDINGEILFSSNKKIIAPNNLSPVDFSIKPHLSTAPSKNYSLLSTGLYYKNNNLLNINLEKNYKTIYIGSENIHDMYYMANLENIPAFLRRYNIPPDEFPKTLINLKDIYAYYIESTTRMDSDILGKYALIYANSLQSNNITLLKNQQMDINNQTFKGKRFLITLNGSETLLFVNKLLSTAKDDKTLFANISSYHDKFPWLILSDKSGKGFENTYREFLNSFDAIINNKELLADSTGAGLQMELFVDTYQNVLFRKINIKFGKITYNYEINNFEDNSKIFYQINLSTPNYIVKTNLQGTEVSKIKTEGIRWKYDYAFDIQPNTLPSTQSPLSSKIFPVQGTMNVSTFANESIQISGTTLLSKGISNYDINKFNISLDLQFPSSEFLIPLKHNHVFDLNKRTLFNLYVESDKFTKNFKKFQQKNPELFEFVRGF